MCLSAVPRIDRRTHLGWQGGDHQAPLLDRSSRWKRSGRQRFAPSSLTRSGGLPSLVPLGCAQGRRGASARLRRTIPNSPTTTASRINPTPTQPIGVKLPSRPLYMSRPSKAIRTTPHPARMIALTGPTVTGRIGGRVALIRGDRHEQRFRDDHEADRGKGERRVGHRDRLRRRSKTTAARIATNARNASSVAWTTGLDSGAWIAQMALAHHVPIESSALPSSTAATIRLCRAADNGGVNPRRMARRADPVRIHLPSARPPSNAS